MEQLPLNQSTIPADLTLHIRAEPLSYSFGYSHGHGAPHWLAELSSSWLAFAPEDYLVFTGASFALFASGGGEPWGYESPEVGFRSVREEHYGENMPNYDVWE